MKNRDLPDNDSITCLAELHIFIPERTLFKGERSIIAAKRVGGMLLAVPKNRKATANGGV